MQAGTIQIKNLKIFEILATTLLISLMGMYLIACNSPDKIPFIQIQFIIATALVAVASFVKFSFIHQNAYAMYAATLVLLALVLVYGHSAGGATRWISLWNLRFQPSELLKFVLPLVLIKYYQSKQLPLSKNSIYISILIITVPIFLVLIQPDLGTAIIIMATSVFVPYLLGLKRRTIKLTACLLLATLPIIWNLMLPYQQLRVLAFLWPSNYAPHAYQVKQAIMAINHGGMFGQGKMQVAVPAGTTDFIFSLYACRFGAIGILVLLFLFARLINGIIYLAKTTPNPILAALAGSYAFLLTSSLLVNVCMVTGMLPVVGLPMPFMSYGGTAFIINITIITILATAFRNTRGPDTSNLGPDFRKRQHIRLKRLTNFLYIGLAIILARLTYIHFTF